MSTQKTKMIAGVVTLTVLSLTLGGGAGYWFAKQHAPDKEVSTRKAKVLYWYDPMRPEQHFDKGGKSPFMDMQLVPKYADEGQNDQMTSNTIRIDPQTIQNLGVRVESVTEGTLDSDINANGVIILNDRLVAVMQSRSNGFVQRVYAHAIGDVVQKGDPIVDVLMPEWVAAQTEFLAVLKTGDQTLIEATRQRLVILGIPEEIISQVARKRKPLTIITLYAPITGFIQALDVRMGMTLSTGQSLAKINGLDPVWLEAAIPEAQAALLKKGNQIDAKLTAYPDSLKGKVIEILPEMNLDSRTLKVRIELPNPHGQLKAGMFAQTTIHTGKSRVTLMVPEAAVIRTGTRNVVIESLGNGRFQPIEVQPGMSSQGKTAVLGGLKAGQQVIVSGQFLIDSEANLQGVLDRLNGAAAPGQSSSSMPMPRNDQAISSGRFHHGVGRVESLTHEEITISHQPITSMGWGAMTMPFKLDQAIKLEDIRVADQVSFKFQQINDAYVITSVQRKIASSAPMEGQP